MSAKIESLDSARDRAKERDKALCCREEADIRLLLECGPDFPSESADGRVWWCALRPPEPFEVPDAGPDVAVLVAARAHGLTLHVERQIIRRPDRQDIPLTDRKTVSALMRAGQCVFVCDAPRSREIPSIGLRLRVEIEESIERDRVVATESEQ